MSTIDPTPPPPPTAASSSSTTTLPAIPISPTQSAALRLNTLEYLLHGHLSSSSSSSSSSSTSGILLRLSTAISQLETIKQSSGKSLTRLVDDWDSYSDLLHPLDPSTRSPKQEVWDPKEQATYLLTQYEELTSTLRDLTKIETLLDQGKVLDGDATRNLSRAITDPQVDRLKALQTQARTENQRSKTLQERTLTLVRDWSSYTTTLSHAFTLLDQELLQLERQVLSLERHH